MSTYTDALERALGVVNPLMVAARYQCPLIIFSTGHAHAFGTRDHRVEVYYFRLGEQWKSKPIRLGGGRLKESRAAHLEAAVTWAQRRDLGVEEWVPTGFANSWIPKEVKVRMAADVKAWRNTQAGNERRKEEKK